MEKKSVLRSLIYKIRSKNIVLLITLSLNIYFVPRYSAHTAQNDRLQKSANSYESDLYNLIQSPLILLIIN